MFECVVDAAQAKMLRHKFCAIMDEKFGRLRFYYLDSHYQAEVDGSIIKIRKRERVEKGLHSRMEFDIMQTNLIK